jgi:prophage regulatory protein
MSEAAKQNNRILRQPEVSEKTGRSRAAIYADMEAGHFPKAIKLGGRAVGWLEHEIDEWIENRVSASRER